MTDATHPRSRGQTPAPPNPELANAPVASDAPRPTAAPHAGRATVLVVDDDDLFRRSLVRTLRVGGYETREAGNVEGAWSQLADPAVSAVLLDQGLPDERGLSLLERMRDRRDDRPVIIISGSLSATEALHAMSVGASDVLEKPIGLDRLLVSLEKALSVARAIAAERELRGQLTGIDQWLLGASPAMERVRELVARVARSDGRVLVLGENGTGKELVATAIHDASRRRDGPFVKVNCGAIPAELVESEFFGHERGAFTGAVALRRGRFELAHGGTLLLDEIGEMPPAMQVKLLRVLQEHEIERVGASHPIPVDVRVIAATNRNLAKAVELGTFREDLYYRINVVSIRLPPLRDRLGDLPLLAAHILRDLAEHEGLPPIALEPDACALLQEYAFPGNVRELRNILERLVVLSTSPRITASDVRGVLHTGTHPPPRPVFVEPPPSSRPAPSPSSAPSSSAPTAAPPVATVYRAGRGFHDLMDDQERQLLVEALDAHGGNKSATARALGLERSFFNRKCRKYGITTEG